MKNAVGREIPDELLVNNKRVYSGKNQIDGQYEQKVGRSVELVKNREKIN